jgi:ankyrin repeat protein
MFRMTIALACIMSAAVGCASASEKPLLRITPGEAFMNPELRSLANAASRGDVKRIQEIVRSGVDVNGKGDRGITAIYFALRERRRDSFEKLLELGADPNLIWDYGNSVMHFAAGIDDPFFLSTAISHGGDVNLVNPEDGETPIFRAVRPDGKKNVVTLIRKGADLNVRRSITGQTPLLAAAHLNQYDAAYQLLEAGADFTIKSAWNTWIMDNIVLDRRTMDPEGPLSIWREKCAAFVAAKSKSH